MMLNSLGVGWVRQNKRRTRDNQRSKVYKADNVLKQYSEPLPSVADVEQYVRKVWDRKVLQKAFPNALGRLWALPYVKDGRRNRTAKGCSLYIVIPRWARNSAVVLHELAHVITSREHQGVAAHGPEYCRVFLRLVQSMMGSEAHDKFKDTMKELKIRHRLKKACKPISMERRLQLLETLAVARAKRMENRKRREATKNRQLYAALTS